MVPSPVPSCTWLKCREANKDIRTAIWGSEYRGIMVRKLKFVQKQRYQSSIPPPSSSLVSNPRNKMAAPTEMRFLKEGAFSQDRKPQAVQSLLWVPSAPFPTLLTEWSEWQGTGSFYTGSTQVNFFRTGGELSKLLHHLSAEGNNNSSSSSSSWCKK